jgi:hypothetical protein
MYKHVCPHANATCFVRPSNEFCLRCRIQINVDSANNSDANSEKARKERTVLVAQIAALMSSESYDGSRQMILLQKRLYQTHTWERAALRVRDRCRIKLAELLLELKSTWILQSKFISSFLLIRRLVMDPSKTSQSDLKQVLLGTGSQNQKTHFRWAWFNESVKGENEVPKFLRE